MATEEERERDGATWMQGHRAAWTRVLQTALTELGYEGTEASLAKWVLEREQAVQALRRICEEWGDNEWSHDLHLADVIDKHLERHLEPEE